MALNSEEVDLINKYTMPQQSNNSPGPFEYLPYEMKLQIAEKLPMYRDKMSLFKALDPNKQDLFDSLNQRGIPFDPDDPKTFSKYKRPRDYTISRDYSKWEQAEIQEIKTLVDTYMHGPTVLNDIKNNADYIKRYLELKNQTLGNTALMESIQLGKYNDAEKLLNYMKIYKVNVNSINKYKDTALTLAVKTNKKFTNTEADKIELASLKKIIQMLIDAGADLDLKDGYGYTALIIAATKTNIHSTEDIVKMLINANAQVNEQSNDGSTALMLAANYSAKNSTEGTVQLLLNKGAKPDLQDEDGNTALILAAMYSKESSTENTVRMLINAGADLDLQNNDGNTAILRAASYSKDFSTENTVKMLINAGADLNLQNNDGNTALMRAAKNSNEYSTENTVKMLINAGADLNLKNNEGNTALMIAVINSKNSSTEDTVKMLINAGADLNLQNNDGNTALMLARRYASPDIINMLVERLESQQ